MLILPLNALAREQLKKFGLGREFEKQKTFFEANPYHPSLNTEKLEPKSIGLYSFRIDKKYRAIFRVRNGKVEIVHLTKHYQK